MAVFPEAMNKLDIADTEGSLRVIENYIRYMGERVEFSNRNMARSFGNAELTTVEVMEILTGLTGAISILQNTVNSMKGDVTAMQSEVETAVSDAEAAKSAAEAAAAQHITGTYTGNGADTTRIINVGGKGALIVYSGGIMAIVTADGMHYMSDTTEPTYKDASVASYADGKLTLATASYINVSDQVYTYQVL